MDVESYLVEKRWAAPRTETPAPFGTESRSDRARSVPLSRKVLLAHNRNPTLLAGGVSVIPLPPVGVQRRPGPAAAPGPGEPRFSTSCPEETRSRRQTRL